MVRYTVPRRSDQPGRCYRSPFSSPLSGSPPGTFWCTAPDAKEPPVVTEGSSLIVLQTHYRPPVAVGREWRYWSVLLPLKG